MLRAEGRTCNVSQKGNFFRARHNKDLLHETGWRMRVCAGYGCCMASSRVGSHAQLQLFLTSQMIEIRYQAGLSTMLVDGDGAKT